MLDLMDWFFTLFEPISAAVVFIVMVICLFGLSFIISFLVAKFES